MTVLARSLETHRSRHRVTHSPSDSPSESLGESARERLLAALLSQTDEVPCTGADASLWTSEIAAERALAASRCTSCPVIGECAEAADEQRERWFVYAGIDRSRKSRKALGQPRLRTETGAFASPRRQS